jgi:predicted phage-related endonuclease
MGVTGIPRCHLVVLLGGDDLKIYPLESDGEAQGLLFDACEKFWKDYVLTKRPPPVDDSDSYSEWLTERFQGGTPSIMAPSEAETWARQFFAAKEALEKAESQKEEARNHLKEMCLSAKRMKGQGWTLSWVEKKGSTEVDWPSLWNEIKGHLGADQQMALLSRFSKEKNGATYVTIREAQRRAA